MERIPGVSASVPVSLEELLEACEYVSSVGFETEAAAYVCCDTGRIYFVGTDLEPEEGSPEDLESSERYVLVPSKQDLDLSRRVALRFAEVHLPQQYERVRSIFSRSGAYARFKDLLDANGQLTAWFEFETAAQREALSAWCVAQGLEPVGNTGIPKQLGI